MIDRSFIGRTSEPRRYDVEKGHVRRFAEAIGDENRIYFDEEAARAAGYAHIPAPPTFATVLRPHDARQGMGIDMKKVLHGEQEFEYRRPLLCGDIITVLERVADIYEKQGKSGPMDFLVLETTATDAQGEIVFFARKNIVVKR